MMKAQFMMLWDGLSSARHCQVVVMGATNRPQDVDKAILRRMPAMFQIGLPTQQKRADMLALTLHREVLDGVDLNYIANVTHGFSGSDLKELCRGAAMFRVRELGAQLNFHAASSIGGLRAITMHDFTEAVRKMKESKVLASGRLALDLEAEGLD